VLVLLALVVGFTVACDLDEGDGFTDRTDPTIVIDPSSVNVSVTVEPRDVPGDGEATGTVVARLLIDGQPVAGIPVLFYSEWGRLYTACTSSQTPTISQFGRGLLTSTLGTASVLLEAPVLPDLFNDTNESNTIAAFFLIDGQVFPAFSGQNIWKVQLKSMSCVPSNCRTTGDSITVIARYGTARHPGVTGCAGATWSVLPSSDVSFIGSTLCTDQGETRNTFIYNREEDDTEDHCYTVQVATRFAASGPNECVLDQSVTQTIASTRGICFND
jgi:hypothetical protein